GDVADVLADRRGSGDRRAAAAGPVVSDERRPRFRFAARDAVLVQRQRLIDAAARIAVDDFLLVLGRAARLCGAADGGYLSRVGEQRRGARVGGGRSAPAARVAAVVTAAAAAAAAGREDNGHGH